MKKKKIVLLIILILVAIIVSVASIFVVKNWNKLYAAYYALTGRSDELEQKYQESEEKLKESIKDLGIETIRPLTEEESDKLNNGEISQDEAIDLILGRNEENTAEKTDESDGGDNKEATTSGNNEKTNSDKNTNTGSTAGDKTKPATETKKEELSPEYKEKNEEISRLIGELYVLKSQFSADLTEIENWVNEQYMNFCEEYGGAENIPSSVKTKVGKRAYEKALALEDECDVKVNEILSKVKVLLKETNQSTAVVDEIKASYDNEKSVAISYYMSQF